MTQSIIELAIYLISYYYSAHVNPEMTWSFSNIADQRPPSSHEARINLDTQSRISVAADPPGLHTEHVLSEERGQGEPTYEDILPYMIDEGSAIELETNVAYSTATTVIN